MWSLSQTLLPVQGGMAFWYIDKSNIWVFKHSTYCLYSEVTFQNFNSAISIMYTPLKMNFCKDVKHVAVEPFFRDNFLNNLYDNLELSNSVKNLVSPPPAVIIAVPTCFSTGGAPLNANGVTFSKNVWSTRLSGWLQSGLQKVNLG